MVMLALLMAINGLNMIDRHMLGLLLPQIKQEVLLSDTQLGLVGGAAFAITYSVAGVPLAMIADRLSRRNLIATGVAFWSVVLAATGRAGNAVQLFLGRMLLGVGEASIMAPSSSLIADLFPGRTRTIAIAFFTAGASVGLMLGYPLVGWLAQTYGWRSAFLGMGLIGLPISLAFVLIGREPLREHQQRTGAAGASGAVPFGEGLGLLARSVPFLLMVGSGICFSVTNSIMNVWTPTFLVRVHHLNLTETGAMLGLYRGLVGIFAAIGGGALVARLAARDRRWPALAPAIMCLLMVPVELLFLWLDAPWAWQLGLILDTVLMSAITPCAFNLLLLIIDSRIRAFGTSIYLLIFSLIGQSLGGAAVGMLNDRLMPVYLDDAVRLSMTVSPVMIGLSGLFLLALSRRL